MHKRHGHAHTRQTESTTNVPFVPIFLITDTISSENADISSLNVDNDSHSGLDIPIAHIK